MTHPFSPGSTAMDVAGAADLRGRTALVTGATSGLGFETARALAAAGADLVLGVRNVTAGEETAEMIRDETARSVVVDRIDLCDFASVADFSAKTLARVAAIDILVANAGASKTPETHQADGLDVRFAGNHLGHFLLAHRLREALRRRGARIVVLTSAAQKGRPIQLDDLGWQTRGHDMFAAYGESKTANILFTMEATRRWAGDGIVANAVLPGSVLTGLQRHHGEEVMRRIGFLDEAGRPNPVLRTVAQGAATPLWAATSPDFEGLGGRVLEDCREARPYTPDMHPWAGFDPNVLDEHSARRLWDESRAILSGLGFEC